MLHYVNECVKSHHQVNSTLAQAFINSNTEQFEVYSILGDYYLKNKDFTTAIRNYKIALSKEIPLQKEVQHINEQLKKCEEQKANS